MDARRKDEYGRTVCPACKKAFWPELGGRDPEQLIQNQFPNATKEQREQLVSGICGDACWSKHLGIPDRPE